MNACKGLLLGIVALGLCRQGWGQDGSATKGDADLTQTFFLNSTSSGFGNTDTRQIYDGVRQMLPPDAKITYVQARDAMILRGTQQQIDLVRRLLKELDRGSKTYRLTYTITEFDGAKHVGTQHFSMVVVAGQRSVMKQGSKVPIVTGSLKDSSGAETQVTYLDVGLNFDVTLDESANGVRLRSKEEQSGIAEQPSQLGGQDPVVRQTVLEGTSILTPGKPLVLGSLDIPGTTRRQDVEVVMEVVP
jgi:type II secretory pathway component GspD/PulD (secretin)